MPEVDTVPTTRTLVEVAWLASRVGGYMIDQHTGPSERALCMFWQSIRALQRAWTDELDLLTLTSDDQIALLEALAAQVFSTEMTARVWATILTGIDRETDQSDLARIASSAVRGLLQVRHQLVAKLLNLPVEATSRAAALDRLRRRCDRWTDLLIGNMIGTSDLVEFAFDPARARDFAEEGTDESPAAQLEAVEHLMTAGLRLGLLGILPSVALDLPPFNTLIQSILSSLPSEAFDREGTLRLRRHLVRSRIADETPLSTPDSDDVLIPGISFTRIRKRFR